MSKLKSALTALGFLAGASDAAHAQVAFVPQVSSFPSGVGLDVTPVVSADRRYVRLSVNAAFTGLQGFDTINVPAAVGGGGVGAGGGGLGGGGLGLGGGGLGAGGGAGGGFRSVGMPYGGLSAGMDGVSGSEPKARFAAVDSPIASAWMGGNVRPLPRTRLIPDEATSPPPQPRTSKAGRRAKSQSKRTKGR